MRTQCRKGAFHARLQHCIQNALPSQSAAPVHRLLTAPQTQIKNAVSLRAQDRRVLQYHTIWYGSFLKRMHALLFLCFDVITLHGNMQKLYSNADRIPVQLRCEPAQTHKN